MNNVHAAIESLKAYLEEKSYGDGMTPNADDIRTILTAVKEAREAIERIVHFDDPSSGLLLPGKSINVVENMTSVLVELYKTLGGEVKCPIG